MRTLLFYLLQVILASGILYGYYHLMLRNKKFHQYNRFYLLASVVISVLIPFLNIPVYFAETEIQSSTVLQTLQTISSTGYENEVIAPQAISPEVTSPFNWSVVLYILYSLAALLFFIRILISLKKIRSIIRNHPVEHLNGVRFINTIEPGTPYSFFRWLFWNKKIELRSEKGEQIFRHEVFHIQQMHSLDIVFMELLSVIFWINPFFHLMKKEIKAIHEFLADKFAADKTEKWEYAELLLMQALSTQQGLVNPFFHNQIKRRIAMITNPKRTSHRYLRKLLVLPVAAIVLILFAFKYKNRDAEAAGANGKFNDAITERKNITASLTDTIPKPHTKRSVFYDQPNKLILEADTIIFYPHPHKSKIDFSKVLVIINGKKEEAGILKKNTIISKQVTFYSKGDAETMKQFGQEGYSNGVVIFEDAKILDIPPVEFYKENFSKIASGEKDNIVFEKVEIESSFPGGETEWRKYLQKNLNPSIPVEKNAPAGVYTIYVQFIVHTDGFISDVKALTNHGFGMEEEAIRIIKIGPKWVPAIQNGRNVNAYRKQPVNFVVGKDKNQKVTTIEKWLPEIVMVGHRSSNPNQHTATPGTIQSLSLTAGGSAEWRRFFERNLDPNAPINEGWAEGTYKILVQFTQNEDGTLSEIKALTYRDSKTAENCINILKHIQRMLPLKNNDGGQKVYFIQPFIFQITSEQPSISSNDPVKSSNIPKISVSDLKNASVYKLLQVDEGTEILGYTFSIDITNDITQVANSGNKFNTETINLINNAGAGRFILFENIRLKIDGQEKKTPARFYEVTD